MQASWNQWSGQVNNYATTAFPNPFPNATSVPGSNSFSVPPIAPPPVANPALPNSQFPGLYNSQQAQSTQQQWQQWEQWQQQYAQWQQQYGDKYQGPVPTPGLMPSATHPTTYPTIPPLPPSAPSAQPPPPDSVPPTDKDESHKRPHDGTGHEESKKQKSGKGKQETLDSLIESEKTFDQQFKSWEASFLQWKEQNVNHPDKTQYKEYEAKCESYREQLLQKREVLRKKRENKEAEVAAAAKEAALATSSAATAQLGGYKTTQPTQSAPFMPPPAMMYPPMPSMFPAQDPSRLMPNQQASTFMPNYSMFSMPPPPSLPPMTGPPPLTGVMDDDLSKKNAQSLEFLSAAPNMSNAKGIPGLDLVGSDRNPNAHFSSNLPPSSSLFSPYSQDVTKPLHTTEDKPFNFPRPPTQQNFATNNPQNQYSFPPGRSEFENDSRMNHSGRNVPYSQFDRSNQGRDGGDGRHPNQHRDGNDRFQNQGRDGNDRFQNQGRDGNDRFQNQGRDGNDRFPQGREGNDRFMNHGRDMNDRFPNQGRDGNDGFQNQNSYGGRDDYQYRKTDAGSNFRNNDRNRFGAGGGGSGGGPGAGAGAGSGAGGTSSFALNSDKYAKYLEDEYDDSRFRDPEPEEDYSPRKPDYQRDEPPFRNNFSGRPQNFRNDSGSFFGKQRGGQRGFNDRNYRDEANANIREDSRTGFQDRGPKEGGNFGGFSRDGNKFGGGRGGFGRPPFGRDAPDTKEPANKFESVDKNAAAADPLKPMSLLDLPPMKPPETRDRFQSPGAKPPDSFDPKFPPPALKAPEPFNQNQMAVDAPKPPFSAENGSALPNESAKLPNTVNPKSVLPSEDDLMLTVPFIPSQTYEYHHSSNPIENPHSFEPIWVFDYSHGKKKTLEPFKMLPKSDVIKDFAPKSENLFKNDKSWAEGSWNEIDKNLHANPLPERTRNTSYSNSERKSNTPASLLDKSEPLNHENKDEKKDAVAWLHPQITLKKADEKPTIKPIDSLLLVPERNMRPSKIVIFMRGPPGSGKSYTAKLIKDKEVEVGGSAPRILSLDDYYSLEDLEGGEPESDGKNYDALESSYLDSFVKSFKKNIQDGFFPFIIVDCINDKVKKYEEMYNFAKSKGFQAYICEMDRDVDTCKKQNVHGRSEEDIQKIINEWEQTPSWQTVLDIKMLTKPSEEMEIDLTEEVAKEEKEEVTNAEERANVEEDKEPETESNDTPDPAETEDDPASSADKEAEDYSSYMEVLCSSKWEKMEQTEEKLARLDGVNRKRNTSFKEWLQLPEDKDRDLSWYTSKDADAPTDVSAPRKKRVRWADLEERVAQQKMREIGFVVGHTDWKRMMDPSFGGNALTQTKYI